MPSYVTLLTLLDGFRQSLVYCEIGARLFNLLGSYAEL